MKTFVDHKSERHFLFILIRRGGGVIRADKYLEVHSEGAKTNLVFVWDVYNYCTILPQI
jgi:hypothetical protein